MAKATVLLSVAYLLLVMRGVSGDACQGYGECGLNGICQVVRGLKSHCSCPPGFDFVQKGNPSKGCFQKETNSCSGSKSSGKMQDLGHIDWWGNDYAVITPVSQSDCKQACLEDCLCTVVIYATLEGAGYCWKKAMPLRDGRASITRTAFVKVSKI